ncbi:MAG: FAD-dependent oxidoreductase [bacterium]|nr:FAD-dependent oxidoreductase [bacterium]
MYDLIILGGGAAGLTAAIYAVRYRLKTLIISKDVGGLILEAHKVENWPGVKSTTGNDLMKDFKEHALKLGVEIAEGEIVDIEKKDNVELKDNKGKIYESKSLILALGTQRRKLNVQGEAEFLGKGVSYCAVCDAPFFKDKTVAVIGGNDSAANAALLLAEHAKKVYIIYRKEKIRAEPINLERVEKSEKIEIINNSNVTEITGTNFVEKAKLDSGKEIELNGIFIEIGSTPTTVLLSKIKVETDDRGYIKVNEKMETNAEGVFAAGDITTGSGGLRQLVTAASEGAIAATSAFPYVRKKK